MIRRELGNDFLLIRQDDHGMVAGELAVHFGNAKFSRTFSVESMITAARMHDAGWRLHDDAPTLNDRHQPLDVFETPHSISLKIWTASVDRTVAVDPYAGLLVSMHVLSLSAITGTAPEKLDAAQLAHRFELNKFQHREVERQEQLRRQLGLRTDLPLTLGLPAVRASDEDDKLLFNFRLLQALDMLSLSLCCTELPAAKTLGVFPYPGKRPVQLALRRSSPFSLMVDPWPFDAHALQTHIPARRIPARLYQDQADLQQAIAFASTEQLGVTIGMAE